MRYTLVALLLLLAASGAMAKDRVVVGQISEITPAEIIMTTGHRYPLMADGSGADAQYQTEFYDHQSIVNGRPARVTFGTLYDVGYVKKARLTINDGRVTRVEVLSMEQ